MALISGQIFRLLPPGSSNDAKSPGIQYVLYTLKLSSPKHQLSGSYSFDIQYKSLEAGRFYSMSFEAKIDYKKISFAIAKTT
jgi:hypothetical protein